MAAPFLHLTVRKRRWRLVGQECELRRRSSNANPSRLTDQKPQQWQLFSQECEFAPRTVEKTGRKLVRMFIALIGCYVDLDPMRINSIVIENDATHVGSRDKVLELSRTVEARFNPVGDDEIKLDSNETAVRTIGGRVDFDAMSINSIVIENNSAHVVGRDAVLDLNRTDETRFNPSVYDEIKLKSNETAVRTIGGHVDIDAMNVNSIVTGNDATRVDSSDAVLDLSRSVEAIINPSVGAEIKLDSNETAVRTIGGHVDIDAMSVNSIVTGNDATRVVGRDTVLDLSRTVETRFNPSVDDEIKLDSNETTVETIDSYVDIDPTSAHSIVIENDVTHVDSRDTVLLASSQTRLSAVGDDKINVDTKDKVVKRKRKRKVVKKPKGTKTATKSFTCDICDKIFGKKSHLVTHVRLHTGDKPYECPVCRKTYAQAGNLKHHVSRHTDKKPYECPVCRKTFTRADNLRSHSKIHLKNRARKYECQVCREAFSRAQVLRIHARTHTGEKPYQCQVCQKAFAQKGHLKYHGRIHTGENPFQCPVCQKALSSSNSLQSHTSRIHPEGGKRTTHKCKVCEKIFARAHVLRAHARTHTGEKPFECQVCKRTFSQMGILNHHSRIHSGEKPYECRVCERSFARLDTLQHHASVHSKDRAPRFECQVCEKSFSHRQTLKSHAIIHLGEKPYQCRVCHVRFSVAKNLKTHNRNMHQ